MAELFNFHEVSPYQEQRRRTPCALAIRLPLTISG
jgi:hypothetical protein